ncbi:MAG: hypothetical protein KF718_22925 [Polyangiaceae bacterium]|nr:hypothetical protein [Polyangiaceae bacterium]
MILSGHSRRASGSSSSGLLVSVGEASGDDIAAPVVRTLGTEAFGLIGPKLAAAGSERVGDLTSRAAMGVGGALRNAPVVVLAAHRLLAAARARRPRAALLVGNSELNATLGLRLRRLGVRVLWASPPQVWAWRSGRIHSLAESADRFAVILPFEEALWQGAGANATYVGHPSLADEPLPRQIARDRLGLTPLAEVVALLPGSRSAEVKAHLESMLEAIATLRAERGAIDARVLIAPTLDSSIVKLISRRCQEAGLESSSLPPARMLGAFDVALVSSGTATLQCAVLGVPPVVVYRPGPVTELVARRLVRTPHIGLPNVVLGERVFPELLGDEVTSDALADEASRWLDAPEAGRAACARVRARLEPGAAARALGSSPPERIAALLAPWLEADA